MGWDAEGLRGDVKRAFLVKTTQRGRSSWKVGRVAGLVDVAAISERRLSSLGADAGVLSSGVVVRVCV